RALWPRESIKIWGFRGDSPTLFPSYRRPEGEEAKMPRSFRALVGLAGASAFALLATSCVGTFYIRARGDVKTGVVFAFYASRDATRASITQLTEFEVQHKVGTDGWSPVWKSRGEGRVETIQYGVVPTGFPSITAPLPMSPNASYRAFGEGESWPKGR